MNQALATAAIVTLAAAGIGISNILHDRGVDASRSRCLAAALGGAAFLLAVLWLPPWTAVAVTGALTLAIVAVRLRSCRRLRGAQGNRPGQRWAEVTFALAAVASLAFGWGVLGERWLAFLPIAFVGWGDNAAGFIRATVCHTRPASLWPSAAMLGVCLATAVLVRPFWIGAAGAVAATTAERIRPRVSQFWDDNVNIVACAFAVMSLLKAIS